MTNGINETNVKAPKIVIIGAGSAIFGLGSLATLMQHEHLKGAHIALCDINEQGLDMMTRLAHTMNTAWDTQATITSSVNRRDLLHNADFVILSIQAGQRETMWERDWQIPLEHGIRQPYAENGGPGSFAHMARNLPPVLAIARDMEKLCPDAYCLNLVNPLIRLTTAIHRYTTIKVIGLCHQLLWGYAMAATILADRFEITIPDNFHVHTDAENMKYFIPVAQSALTHLDIRAAGTNHFSWVYDIRDRHTGEDLYPILVDRWLNDPAFKHFEPLSREILDIYGMMPTAGDSHMCEFLSCVSDNRTKPWEKYKLKLQNWGGNRQRRAYREQLAWDIVAGRLDVDGLRDVWNYEMLDEGLPDLIGALHYNQSYYHQQLNVPNQGFIPNLPDDAIVEVPGVVSALGVQGLSFPALPAPIAEMCRRELQLSSMYVDAAYHSDRQLALQAMLLDPMVTDIDTARLTLRDLLRANQAYLPQFDNLQS
jgi:alpha-galactosidase